MGERLDQLKALRLRTGAPWWRCAEAIDEYGSVDAALQAMGALSICDWDPAWAVRFLCAAGAAHLLPGESPVTDGPVPMARVRQRFGAR